MVAPAFRSKGAAKSDSGTATFAFAVPAGVAADDIIVLPIYIGSDTVTVSSMPSGFAHVPGSPIVISGAGAQTTAVLWKRATGADTGTYTVVLSGSTFAEGIAVAYSGAIASGDPWDDTDFASTPGVSGSTTPPVTVTTSVDDTMLCWMGSCWAGGDWTPPTGFTERLDDNVSVNTFADKVQAAAGSSGAVTGTVTTSDKRTAWLGAMLPVPSGPNEGSVALGLGLAVAAVGKLVPKGVAALGLGLAVAAVGGRRSAGVVALGLNLAVSATGKRVPKGAAALTLGLAVSATGRRTSRGAAALGLRLAVAASGQVTTGRPSKLTARSRTEALRARGATVRLIARGGYPDA